MLQYALACRSAGQGAVKTGMSSAAGPTFVGLSASSISLGTMIGSGNLRDFGRLNLDFLVVTGCTRRGGATNNRHDAQVARLCVGWAS